MKITSSTGVLSVAPVGTDPADTDAFVPLGHMFADAFSFEPAEPAEPVDMLESLTKARTMLLEAEYETPNREALDAFFGIPIVESDAVPQHSLLMDMAGFRIYAPRTEPRPFTDLEREGEWAKRTVRHGMADVLAWLGEDVGPEPDAAYTDYLMTVSLFAGIAGGLL